MNVEGLVDGVARLQIREALDLTLVVEAAAGTGKTTELVRRIVTVVESGRGRLASLIAVTFTEKAAGEMKLRIRTELDRALGERALDDPRRPRLVLALSELESAKVGTIHALCSELLREYPVEAGVDPSFELADSMHARLLLERAFDRWFQATLTAPGEGVRRVLARRSCEERAESSRELLLGAARNLVETRDFDTPYRRDPLDRAGLIARLMGELEPLAELVPRAHSVSDPLRKRLQQLAARLSRVAREGDDVREALLRRLPRDRSIFAGRRGFGEWYGPGLARAEVIARLDRARAEIERGLTLLNADLAACLQRELAPVVSGYEAEKRAHGTLDFFDLLLGTRNLLRDHAHVRRSLQERVSQLFVDEFQDTDPVQSEILLLMSADDPRECDPWRVRPVPGKLFVVGDPKQSIYRFRRADVALYERIKAHLLSLGAELLVLSTSFRSLPAIQSLVNASFAPLMSGHVERGHASYVPLAPHREARVSQPAIVALPAPKPYGSYGKITKRALNACLPDAVASWLDWLLTKSRFVVQEAGRDVPVEARHVCLLFRRFRAYGEDITREYVRALEARRIPHVLSGGRSFHVREEVIALRAVLSAIEWPDDALHVYATLRGPFVALSDEALLSFKRHTGHLHPLGPLELATLTPERAEVAEVLALLRELHRARNTRPIPETLSSFLSSLRAHAGIAIWPTGEQALGNVLRVLEYARGYERRGRASSFRGFVEWLAQHAEVGEAADAPVIEESSDGVRIMTIHAAKGLEFPVVVLCDPTAPTRPEYASRYIDPSRRLWAQSLCDAEPIELVEQRERVRDHDEAELVRLAYVATTRAKELLVVPAVGEGKIEGWIELLSPAIYPKPEARRSPSRARGCPEFTGDSVLVRPMELGHGAEASVAPGEHLPLVGEHRVVWWDPYTFDLARRSTGGVTQQDLLRADEASDRGRDSLLEYEAFREQRARARVSGTVPSFHSAAITQLAGEGELGVGLAPHVEVIDSGVERAGRPSGARFGTLVHALFEQVELRTSDEAELLALARLIGRGLAASPAEIERAASDVKHALGHPLFARIRRAEQRGELYREAKVTVCTGPAALREGSVDLAFRERDGASSRMVLVDFKTDVELSNLPLYARQLALYADALRRALSEPVTCLLFRV